jgi:hypothetical protein
MRFNRTTGLTHSMGWLVSDVKTLFSELRKRGSEGAMCIIYTEVHIYRSSLENYSFCSQAVLRRLD